MRGGAHQPPKFEKKTFLFGLLVSLIFERTFLQDLIGTWSTLWHRFSTLSPLTATAEPNCEADLIARRMLSTVLERFSGGIGPPDGFGFTLAFAADLLYIVVDKFRFKEIGRRPKKSKGFFFFVISCLQSACVRASLGYYV